jgi:dTDP-4-dehydrorhamnose reductase
VFGVFHTHPVTVPSVTALQCDLTDYHECTSLMQQTQPDAVIHAAAMVNPNHCQEHRGESRRINVDAAVSIAGLCSDAGIPCVFISTDLIFDGTAPPYCETSEPSPVSVYGEQKLEAERAMRRRHDRLTICRMPLMFGDAPPGAQSCIQPMIRALHDRTPLRLFIDEYRTPVSGTAAAAGILFALEKMVPLIHLGGRERISRCDFGYILAAALGADSAVIRPVRQAEVIMPALRPSDVSFDSAMAFGLGGRQGFNPLPLNEELARLECVKSYAKS